MTEDLSAPATKADIADLRVEWRNEMISQTRWLAALFVVQFIATVGATTGLVSFIVNNRVH